MSKRLCALALCAVLLTTLSFAANKKSQKDRDRSGDWSVWSLQNGDLPDQSLSLSGGGVGGDLHLSQGGGGPLGPPVQNPGTPDNWSGGTGNWSTGGMWSTGVPDAGSDVTIYSGGNDLVTLDLGSTSVNSLALGGASNGFTSELTDGGTTQSLTITGALNVGQQGYLYLYGGSTITAGADSSNAGTIDLENGSTLGITGNFANLGSLTTGNIGGGNTFNVSGNFSNSGTFSVNGSLDLANVGSITNTGSVYLGYGTQLNLSSQAGGVTDVPMGSSWQIYGSFTENSSNFGFENLSSVEGTIDLENVQVSAINPGGVGGTLTIASTGNFDIGNGTSLTIQGDVDNSGYLSTGRYNVGGNTLTITGNMTNEGTGSFILWNGIPPNGSGDTASIGGTFTNYGFTDVEGGSKLNVTGDVNNFGGMYTSFNGTGNNTISIGGSLNNSAFFGLESSGDSVSISTDLNNYGTFSQTGGSSATVFGNLYNTGTVNLENASKLTVDGTADNFGTISTTLFGGTGFNTITIGGQLTNEFNANFELLGGGDTANLNGGLLNNGFVNVDGVFATLNITGDVTNNNEIITNNSTLSDFNSINIYGNLTNNGAFFLQGFGDTLYVMDDFTNNNGFELAGGNENATIAGSVTNTGFFFDVENGSSLNIGGDVTNSGNFYTSAYHSGNNFVTINGTLTNQASGDFLILGPADTVTVGSGSGTVLSNAGFVDVDGGSSFTVKGDADNTGFIYSNSYGYGGGNTLAINGMLTNEKTGVIILYGNPGDTMTVGNGMSNAGFLDLENGSTLTVTGNVTNSDPALITGLYTSYYSGSGFNTININGNLDNQANANFELLGNGDVANVGTFSNEGYTLVATGATLNLTNQPNGITDAVAGSDFELYGTFAAGGNPGFANLNGVEGTANLYGQNFTITPGSGTLTIASGGQLAADYNLNNSTASNITIAGNVDNSGNLVTNFNFINGGNTLTVNGNVTNESGGNFGIFGIGDVATVNGTLTNTGIVQLIGAGSMLTVGTGSGTALTNNAGGFVDVESGSTLIINGDVTNASSGSFQGIYTNYLGDGGHNVVGILGMLTNSGTFQLGGPGDLANINNGVGTAITNNAGAFINVDGGSTLAVTGNVVNAGTIQTDPGGNTITIGGMLTNSGTFELLGPGDMASIGGSVTNTGFFDVFNSSTATIGNGLSTSGTVDLENGSTLKITGDSSNSGNFYTDFSGLGGNNALTITGALDNTGLIWLKGAGDKATISGAVTNELDAEIFLFGGSKATMNGGLTNAGTVDVEGGSTLQVNGDASNSGNLYTNQQGSGGGNSINITGTLTNTGTVELFGLGDTATLGGLTNPGMVDVEHGSTLQINGNATNSGNFYTDFSGLGGNNKVNITGTLDNTGLVWLKGSGDNTTIAGLVTNELDAEIFLFGGSKATMNGGLNNAGTVDVESGSTLQVNGGATNSGNLYTNQQGAGGGNTINITGMLTNESTGTFALYGPGDMASIGNGMNNSGTVNVDGGSTLAITGDVTNSGTIQTDPGHNTITISGMLTNSGTFQLNGPMDTASVGNGLSNSGTVDVFNDSTLTVTAGGATNAASGTIDVENGSTLNITGDVTNNGTMATDLNHMGGGNKLNITGNLTNNLNFGWLGAGDTGTITGNVTNNSGAEFVVVGGAMAMVGGSLTNNAGGLVDVTGGSTLNITGDVTNDAGGGGFQGLFTGFFGGGGNTLNIGGMLTNSGDFEVMGAGDTATITGTASNSGNFEIGGAGSKATMGGLTNFGLVQVANGSTLQVNGDVSNSLIIETGVLGMSLAGGGNTVNITGTLTNQGPDGFGLFGAGDKATIGGDLNNSAVVTINNGSTLQVDGAVNNSGTFGTNLFGNGGGNSVTVNGLLTNTATGTITLNGPGDVLQALAGLSNSGVINVNNGSSIDPPFFNNIGTLNIDGTSRFVVGTPTPMGGQGYIQLHNGTLGEMISMTNFGVINVNGSALLDGTLAILLQGGFNPSVGATYKFLNFTAGSLQGMFANIQNDIFNGGTEKWMVTYDNADGYVELTAESNGSPVPEPATLLVLIPGLLGMGYGLRRRLSK